MLKDQMTPLERAKALAKGEPVDRFQCNPNLSNGIARVYGCKISEFNHSSRQLANAVIATHRRFHGDGAKVFTDLFTLAEAMGAKMKFPDDNTVDLLEPAISDVSQIDYLEPVNPYKDKRLPLHIEAMKYVYDEIGHEVPCSALVVGPFTSACFLIGVEKTTKLMLRNPEAVHKLCEVSLQSCINFAQAAIEQGVGISIAEPMSSCTVISPKHFRTYSAPYFKRFVDFLKSKGIGTSTHICGKTEAIWEDLADMGFGAISVDNVVDLKKCTEMVGDRMKIMGHVDPSSVMYSGTREEVRKETIKCVQQGWRSKKGYGIMSGCGLPVETPIENIDAMLDAAREIGWPVTDEKLEKLLSVDKYK
ncbi:uroporphyrinogen decarboxylase family protein [Marinisporobacter balticus]|uniref:Uroporphyrinogen decarboxylase n=1 Tax=Marinisporobacter balticus TaxID=2018667 RepID=A0A4R2KHR0_9FIRM|nr:uroporphyrinogen decarboxylase family protein [Marinisporobacter balticus]TCO72694.1 uroporphyrinogen decarboxylase [Marinisporobacter balticus]